MREDSVSESHTRRDETGAPPQPQCGTAGPGQDRQERRRINYNKVTYTTQDKTRPWYVRGRGRGLPLVSTVTLTVGHSKFAACSCSHLLSPRQDSPHWIRLGPSPPHAAEQHIPMADPSNTLLTRPIPAHPAARALSYHIMAPRAACAALAGGKCVYAMVYAMSDLRPPARALHGMWSLG
jgi:hypothetical protein